MVEVRDRAQLVDAAALAGRGVGVTVPRSQVEDVLRSEEGTPELQLDVSRRENGDVEAHSVRLEWDRRELEELLKRTEDDGDIELLFDRNELERLIDLDVEAHGLRERAAILAVAATGAAIGAGAAAAQPILIDGGGPVGGGATIEMVSDAASSGPVAAPSTEMVSDAALTGPVEMAAGPSSLVSDSALSGPKETPLAESPILSTSQLEAMADAAAQSPQLVSDSATSGPVDFAAGPSSLVSDSALTGPVEEAAGPSSLVSDSALSGPQSTPVAESPILSTSQLEAMADAAANPQYASAASASGDEGTSLPSPATTGAIAAGAALALSAAFVVRRRRDGVDDNLRPV